MISVSSIMALSELSFPAISDEDSINHADAMLYDGDIDWDTLSSGSISLHRLTQVYTLALAHNVTGKIEYITRALEIARSWADYEDANTDANPYTWHNLSITGRTSALIFLDILCKGGEPLLSDLIKKHAQFLMRKENYLPKQNRGILMDIVLTAAGIYLNDADFLKLGIARLVVQLRHAFPNQAVYHRNSAMHNFDMVMSLSAISGVLSKIGLLEPIEPYINGALTFLMHSVSPLAEMVPIGESYRSFFTPTTGDLRKYSTMGHSGLVYAVSQGMSGEMPTENTKLYHQDGYAFFRSSWEKGGMASWLSLKSGFTSDLHKHWDELSITFVTKGVNVFIDPGICNAEADDTLKQYLQSPFAHNGIIVDSSAYPIQEYSGAGMFEVSEIAGFPCAKAFNNLYPGVYIDRTVMHIGEHEFCIVDDIYSNESHEYTQNFHLSSDVRLVAHSPEGSVLQLPGGWSVCILQHGLDTCEAKEKTGLTDDISTTSVRNTSQDNVQDTTSIQFTQTGKSARFVTTINVVPDSEIDSVLNRPTPLKGDILTFGENIIDVSARSRAFPVKIIASRKDGMLEIDSGDATGEFMYDLLSKETGELVAQVPTGSALQQEGEYILIARRNIGPEVTRWCAGEFATYGKLFNFEPVPLIASVPYIKRHVVHNSGTSRFVFELVLAYHHYPYDIKWEVTKDGNLYHEADGGRMLSINLTEPGNYICHYTVSAKYWGEVERGQFSPVDMQA